MFAIKYHPVLNSFVQKYWGNIDGIINDKLLQHPLVATLKAERASSSYSSLKWSAALLFLTSDNLQFTFPASLQRLFSFTGKCLDELLLSSPSNCQDIKGFDAEVKVLPFIPQEQLR